MEKVKFTVTLTYEYYKSEEDLERFYDTTDLEEAAAIDQKNFEDEPEFIVEDLNQNRRPFTVTVKAEEVTS